ncbi:hypothetical protein ACFLT7_06035 [candidate division KSB1 bacterium]
MGNNISINSTDAMNPANFQSYFNDFPLLSAPTPSQADGCRIFTMSLDMRSQSSTGVIPEYRLYVDQRTSAYWQMWGNGMGGFPSTNTADWSTCANGAIEKTGTGQYSLEFDQFVGFPIAILGRPETGITNTRAIVTSGGNVRIDTYNASGSMANVSSTDGIGIELLMIGKAV